MPTINDVSDELIVQSLKMKEKEHTEIIAQSKLQIQHSEKTLKVIRDALSGYKKLGGTLTNKLSESKQTTLALPKAVEIPKQYSKDLTWTQKIFFVLESFGDTGAYVNQIADEIVRLQPDIPRAKEATTFYCSALKKDGRLGYEKHGIKYKYFINK